MSRSNRPPENSGYAKGILIQQTLVRTHRPQFDGMREHHDAHRKRWTEKMIAGAGWMDWTDCGTCLAISVVDSQDARIALYDSELRPWWQRALFIALVLLCVAAVAVVGAATVILPYLQRVAR